MAVNSVVFILVFLPLAVLLYYVLPAKTRKVYLILVSFVFYIFNDAKFSESLQALAFLIGAILVNFLFGSLLMKSEKTAHKRLFFWIGIVLDVLALFGYKQFLHQFGGGPFEFTIGGLTFRTIQMYLPLGLSFFMFRCISFLADLYLEKTTEMPNLIDTASYISFFPQVTMGPIMQYNAFHKQQAEVRRFNLEQFTAGTKRVIIGIFKKLLVADILGVYVNFCFGLTAAETTPFLAWTGAIGYLIQEFMDFSGYSDLAIGAGMMLGYTCPENFNYPFISKSITEFWQRWHISLGQWLKDYIYLPGVMYFMQAKKPVSKKKYTILEGDLLSLFLTWFVCGAWHGAGKRYILWGMYFFFFLAIEHYLLYLKREKQKVEKNTLRKAAREAKKAGLPVPKSVNPAVIESYEKNLKGFAGFCTKITNNFRKLPKPVSSLVLHLYALLVVLMGETLFRSNTVRDFVHYVGSMFGVGSGPAGVHYNPFMFKDYRIVFFIGVFLSFPILKSIVDKVKPQEKHPVAWQIFESVLLLAMLVLDIALAFNNSYIAFIYNQF